MSMIADLQLSQAYHDIAVKAVDYALRALDGAEPLVPFTITWREGDITLERFRYGAYEDAIELAMRAINAAAGDELEAYAVVWSGYVDGGDGKREAIIVEVGDGDTPRSMQLAQLLALGEDGSPMLDGSLMALGDAPNLLRDRFTVLDQANHLVKPAYVTTDSFARDVKSQPYAQMPVAVICLAANLFEGEEGERITLGIRKLQSLEPDTSIKLIHRVFSIVTSAVASGDLMEVLPTENIEDMAKIILDGATQLRLAVTKGLVWDEHASAYFAAVKSILVAVLTRDGAEPMPEAGARLVAVLDKACA